MVIKSSLLAHVNDKTAFEELSRLLDLVDIAIEQNRIRTSHFLDPYHAALAEGVLRGISGINYLFSGGYPEAERKRLVVGPDYLTESQLNPEIVYLRLTGQSLNTLSHRDYLGAILALGIKREVLGDILVLPESCQVILDQEVAKFVDIHLQRVHKIPVSVEIHQMDNIEIPAVKTKQIKATIASLRLDSVAATGFGVSRSKISKEIMGQRVRLNWKPETNTSALVSEGDLVSCRGRGRVIVKEVGNKSKKGRLHVILERIM